VVLLDRRSRSGHTPTWICKTPAAPIEELIRKWMKPVMNWPVTTAHVADRVNTSPAEDKVVRVIVQFRQRPEARHFQKVLDRGASCTRAWV
jgi:hypothetical protein